MPITTATEVVSPQGYSEECQIDGEVITDPMEVFIVNGRAMCGKHYDELMRANIARNGGEFC